MKIKAVWIFLLSFLTSSTAFSVNVIMIGGAASNIDNFKPILEASQVDGEVIYDNVSINLFTADHRKELKTILEFIDASDEQVILVGYSLGGKIAYKAAIERQEKVIGIFLLDPIDGAPPFTRPSNRYPVWVDESNPLSSNIPVAIVLSDKEFATGLLGVPCVPQAHGPETFLNAMPWAQNFQLTDFSHIDFMYPPIDVSAQISCRKGSQSGSEKGRANILDIWRDFQEKTLLSIR